MSEEPDVRAAARMLSDPTVVSYIGIVDPPMPGVREFFTRLEHSHFAPSSPESAAYRLVKIKFEGALFAVACIPAVYSRTANEIADWIGLRPSMMIPVFIKSGRLEKFPFANERSRILEHRLGHDAYRNDPHLLQKLLLEETARIDAIIAGHLAVLH